MNLDSLTFSLSQINYLVVNLSKKNFKQTSQELSQLVSLYGLEAENQLLRCLLTEAAKASWDTERTGSGSNTSVHASLLTQHLTALLNHPAKSTVVCRAVDNPTRSLQKILKPSNTLLNRLSRLLKFTTAEDVAFSLVLKRNSAKPEIVALTKQHLKKRFLDLVQCYLDAERGHQAERAGLQECSPEVLQTLLTSLSQERLATVTKDLFLKRLRVDFPREVVPIVLAPLLYPDDTQTPLEEMTTADDMAAAMMETSLAEIIRDIGHPFTASVEECKANMLNFGAREPTAIDVARIISMMIRYHATVPEGPLVQTPGNFWMSHETKKDPITHGHGESWNAEVFVQTLKELASNLNWKEVILQLDHPEFMVPDRQGLSLLFTILRLGLQSAGYPANIFPVDYLCRRWTNLEGQMSLINMVLKHPDVFSFADHPFHPVSIDLLKSPPETDNKEIATWRCLYLVELLVYAAERGYYLQVHELFKFPMQHCPDVLLLALLQISPPVTVFRQELLTTLIPIFLGNHPNSGIILHHAWHTQNPNIKPIIMHAMADWYIRGESDQSKLSRILDVAQDLKALSLLLNVQSFPFVIDLACLASRREYLKLDKWLTDKIRDHGETFVTAMVKFLQRRCPQVLGKGPEEQLPKAAQLPPETVTTMLACLQLCVPNVTAELQEAIYSVIANCQTLILSKTRQNIAGIARTRNAEYPRVMPGGGMETPFNPAAGLSGQLFTPHVDSIASLTPGVANLSLGGPGNTAFAMPGTLGPLVTTPGSPSRLMGAGPNSPFAMMPLQHNTNVANMGALARMAPAPAMDKPRIPDPIHFPEMMHNVSKEIEDEANGYFQRIYNHPPHPTLSIDEVLDMLKKFQDSPNKREREVYSCMLRNLFEEYKFFPQYPDKELHITAQLFGGIIEKGLVPSYVSLGLALRFVLDALRKPEGSKMYYFGIAALDRFKSRLKDYHKYCEHVRAIPHFSEFPPHLIEYIEYGLQSQEPPTKPQGPVLPTSLAAVLNQTNVVTVSAPYRAVVCAPSSISVIAKVTNCTAGGLGSRPSIANATNIDTLLTATDREEKINAPPEAIQDKSAFIFNNLSQLNLQTKCEELKEIITEEYFPWLSQYLVMKRASIELNFHALYSNFLDVLKIRDINRMVTKETYRNIKVLLRSDKGIANFSDRSLLKNLGHWLGMLTLARNQPILHVDIDLKALLLEAYHKGQQELLYVVPFVAKVLESCAKSVVFKPPNPWTMALMNVLAELHQEPDLKLNLKFEIEVLCKNLSLDIADLKPTLYLKDPEKLRTIEFQLSQPKPNKDASSSMQVSQPIVPAPQMLIPHPGPPPLLPTEDMAAAAPTPTGLVGTDPTLMGVLGLPEPRFNYLDVNVSSTSAFGQKICFNPHIILFQNYPHLKQFVKPAIERSIQEWIHPVVDRSIKYALTTCEQIIRKDFALDPDEVRMRTCAHHMMRNLTAGMAMITCREQIISTISTNLKAAFLTALMPATPQQEIVESAAAVLATENMELACAFIQKTAVEKALPELDKRLLNDYEMRKIARQEGRRYYDPIVLAYQTERIPERVRLRVSGPSDLQIAVYEEFACNIPGFMPVRDAGMFIPKPSAQDQLPQLAFSQTMNPTQVYGADEMSALISAAEVFLANSMAMASMAAQTANMHSLLECLFMARRNRDIVSGCALLQKAVEGLLDSHIVSVAQGGSAEHVEMMTRYRDIHLRVLKLLEDGRVYGHVWTTKQITYCLTECREELRYNIEAVDCLVRNHLINLPQYDIAMAHLMDNGNNYMAVAFGMQLVQLYLVDDRNNVFANESDLYHITETLYRIMSHSRQAPPEGLGALIEMLRVHQDPSAFLGERSPMGPTAHIHSGILQVRARDYDDPPGLQEKTENLLREWRNVLLSPLTEIEIAQNFNIYVHRMNMNGILKSDDMITRFFRIATQMCIENVYTILTEERTNPPTSPVKRDKYYTMCDSFMKLVTLLIKNTSESGNPTPKLNLLNKILGIIAGCLLQDHEEHGNNFQQLPYHRLLLILFLDMNMAEPVLESMNYQVLTAFCHTLRIIRPSVAPGFCYAWLELTAHRAFINRVLAVTPQQKGWGMYSTLLIDLFKFLDPFLRNTELAGPVMMLYKGTLKVLLVLLHDFPEFLCDYHYGFCDEIPPNCIQMRNLILSAFPRNMRLPDPFTPNLKVDLLAEITLPPRAVINYSTIIPSTQFKKDLDAYLKARAPVTFLSELRSNMQVLNEPGRRYNSQLMNAVVVYVGTQAIAHIRAKGQTPNMSTIAHSAHMDIFQNFTVDFDYEGRYLFLNAIANQLRYPNSHTHYFSCCLLYLFAEANSEAVQEQITRMLLERLIVNRPHPWGLLITFIELIKNPIYKFWTHEFVHCAPEIEKLPIPRANLHLRQRAGVGARTPAFHVGAAQASELEEAVRKQVVKWFPLGTVPRADRADTLPLPYSDKTSETYDVNPSHM
ncbi:CCR4-NOT transcription complex subunit 1 isoform X2 [Ostrinia furnacalis]|uniref:CCR4-NOT transcription complex subunit 1 isoform X2 n=1 Tax=Ostrinia furnacalis TaxID=93504 RepID=UPI00103B54F5|nr:CCR4-NOT transcription complex subunit 1 isoform X2 [Ostrinia furnacalis]